MIVSVAVVPGPQTTYKTQAEKLQRPLQEIRHIGILHSGSKPQDKGHSRSHGLWDPVVSRGLLGPQSCLAPKAESQASAIDRCCFDCTLPTAQSIEVSSHCEGLINDSHSYDPIFLMQLYLRDPKRAK